MRLLACALTASLLLGCTPVVYQRGYLPDAKNESAIKVGMDTKTSVQQRLGDPSTQATFSDNPAARSDAWYYISSVEKQIAFFDPKTEARSILAVHFDKDGKVTSIPHFSLKDGNVVAFESRETPAKGRELTFLQQLFNATPGVPIGAGNTGQQNPGNNGP